MAQGDKILSIQALRGIAAILVVVFHAQVLLEKFVAKGAQPAWLNSIPLLAKGGQVGVDIFFVISGLVIVYTCWDRFGCPVNAAFFLKKRIFRIFPVYWLNLVPWVIVFLFFSHALASHPVFNLEQTIISFFLIPCFNGMNGPLNTYYLLGAAWALTYEFYFYLLVTLALFFDRKWFVPIIIVCFAGGTFIPQKETIPLLTIFSSSLLAEFLYGMAIGYALRRAVRIPKWSALSALLLAPALFWGSEYLPFYRGYSWGIPAALLVFGVVFLDRAGTLRMPCWLSAVGNSSYSLYLSHGIVQSALGKILTLSGMWPALSGDLYVFLISLISILTGYCCWLLTEKPLDAWFSRRFLRREAAR